MPRAIASGEWIPFGDAKTAAGDTGTERDQTNLGRRGPHPLSDIPRPTGIPP